jgi:hypothetical protein
VSNAVVGPVSVGSAAHDQRDYVATVSDVHEYAKYVEIEE